MREIALAIEGDYQYYYMGMWSERARGAPLTLAGYYIHSCQKMRYKANFKPQYILGMTLPSVYSQDTILTATDPENYTWDPLDGELSAKLDQRSYVSLSRDRRIAEGTESPDDTPEADAEINDEELSLFDVHMPGVMTLEEVKALDLDHWLLVVHGSFVHMIVRGWHSAGTQMTNAYRIWSGGNECRWTTRSLSRGLSQSWRQCWARTCSRTARWCSLIDYQLLKES